MKVIVSLGNMKERQDKRTVVGNTGTLITAAAGKRNPSGLQWLCNSEMSTCSVFHLCPMPTLWIKSPGLPTLAQTIGFPVSNFRNTQYWPMF